MGARATLVPSQIAIVHLVLCDFGESGTAYIEADPAHSDSETIVRNMIDGQYDRPLKVVALNPDEGWSRDVSEGIARDVAKRANTEARTLSSAVREFVELQQIASDQVY
jgi:hypothetical protein